MTTRRKRTALITLCLLIGLIAVPVILTWRVVRVEQTPDSQQISFVYKDALYSIPIDGRGDAT